jgi:hypothetical protein
MSKEKSLAPVEQKEVLFYDDSIVAVRVEDGAIYVPLRPLCELLGVVWAAQLRRINRDPILSETAKGVTVTVTPGGAQEMICLPLDYLNGWLFGINATRVKEEIRDRVLRYQRECYKVLSDAFQEGRLTTDPEFDALLDRNSDAVQAYRMAQAVVRLARHQILLEARVDNVESRLENLESSLTATGRHISPEQASRISQAVKAIAMELSKRSGRNEYGGVYGELYRKFEITSYKELPASRYEGAMAFLTDWHQHLVGEQPF